MPSGVNPRVANSSAHTPVESLETDWLLADSNPFFNASERVGNVRQSCVHRGAATEGPLFFDQLPGASASDQRLENAGLDVVEPPQGTTRTISTETDVEDNQKREFGNLPEGVSVGCDPAGDPDMAPKGVPAESEVCHWFDLTVSDECLSKCASCSNGVSNLDTGSKHTCDEDTMDPEWPILSQYAALTSWQRWPTNSDDILSSRIDCPRVQGKTCRHARRSHLKTSPAGPCGQRECPGTVSYTHLRAHET